MYGSNLFCRITEISEISDKQLQMYAYNKLISPMDGATF